MHFIIVEDQIEDQKNLADLIQKNCHQHHEKADFSFYQSVPDFLAHYHPGFCDGIFLDIQLGDMTGIEAARQIRKQDPNIPIIFTTVEKEYALDGFEVGAIDYLLKPLDEQKTARCIGRLREFMTAPSSFELPVSVSYGDRTNMQVSFGDILYAQYFAHVISVHTLSRVYKSRMSFQNLIDLLPHSGRFFVCSRGLVVNFKHILQIDEDALIFRNGEWVVFSRSRKQEILDAFAKWKFTRVCKGSYI